MDDPAPKELPVAGQAANSTTPVAPTQRDTVIAAGAATTGMGGAVAAGLAGLCCAGPATVALLGTGGAVVAATLQTFKPILLIGSLAAIAFGFWYAYGRTVRTATGSCPIRAGRVTRIILWGSALAWVAAALYQPGS
jgi:hypothetical protein